MQIYRLEAWQEKKGVETAGSIQKKNINVIIETKNSQSEVNREIRVMLLHWLNRKLLILLKFKNFENWPTTNCDNSIHRLLKLKY